jgi:hypothetical protein
MPQQRKSTSEQLGIRRDAEASSSLIQHQFADLSSTVSVGSAVKVRIAIVPDWFWRKVPSDCIYGSLEISFSDKRYVRVELRARPSTNAATPSVVVVGAAKSRQAAVQLPLPPKK